MAAPQIRPTKKQQELLRFIDAFISEHGYSPSYREIMAGCGYKSVATVALHVENLIARGHLRKRQHSARSLEVVDSASKTSPDLKVTAGQEKWLIKLVDDFFAKVEKSPQQSSRDVDQLYVLVGALKVLGFEGAANSFIARLQALKSPKQQG